MKENMSTTVITPSQTSQAGKRAKKLKLGNGSAAFTGKDWTPRVSLAERNLQSFKDDKVKGKTKALKSKRNSGGNSWLETFKAIQEIDTEKVNQLIRKNANLPLPEYRKYRVETEVDLTMKGHEAQVFEQKLKALNGPPVYVVNEVDEDLPPDSIELMTDYCVHPDVELMPEALALSCDCKSAAECRREKCICVSDEHEGENVVFPYDRDGHLRWNPNAEHTRCILECNPKCGCQPKCEKSVVTKGRKIPLEVFKTKTKGWGLRCPKDLKKGTFIECYYGDLIHRTEDLNGYYLFDLDFYDEELPYAPRLTIDGEHRGSIVRFMNHSCEPNCRIYPVVKDKCTPQFGYYYLAMFTTRDVQAFEELTFTYAGTANIPKDRRRYRGGKPTKKGDSDDDELDDMDNICRCGARTCRGYLWNDSGSKKRPSPRR